MIRTSGRAAQDEQRMAMLHAALINVACEGSVACANEMNARWTHHRYCGCVRCDIEVIETYHGWTRGERKDGRIDSADGPMAPRALLERAQQVSNLIARKYGFAIPYPGAHHYITLEKAFRMREREMVEA